MNALLVAVLFPLAVILEGMFLAVFGMAVLEILRGGRGRTRPKRGAASLCAVLAATLGVIVGCLIIRLMADYAPH